MLWFGCWFCCGSCILKLDYGGIVSGTRTPKFFSPLLCIKGADDGLTHNSAWVNEPWLQRFCLDRMELCSFCLPFARYKIAVPTGIARISAISLQECSCK